VPGRCDLLLGHEVLLLLKSLVLFPGTSLLVELLLSFLITPDSRLESSPSNYLDFFGLQSLQSLLPSGLLIFNGSTLGLFVTGVSTGKCGIPSLATPEVFLQPTLPSLALVFV